MNRTKSKNRTLEVNSETKILDKGKKDRQDVGTTSTRKCICLSHCAKGKGRRFSRARSFRNLRNFLNLNVLIVDAHRASIPLMP